MDQDVDIYLLGPFKQVAEHARTAIENSTAGASEDAGADLAVMLKAAQRLLREGERATKALEPIAHRQLTLYGSNFIDALRDHPEISEHVIDLDTAVFSFDEFTNPADFDADEFQALGKRTQQAALRLLPLIKRLKLEVPAAGDANSTAPPASTPPSLSPSSPTTKPIAIWRVDSGGNRSVSNASSTAAWSPRADAGEGALPFYPSGMLPRSDSAMLHNDRFPLHQLDEEEPVPMGSQSGPDLGLNGASSVEPDSYLVSQRDSHQPTPPPASTAHSSPVPEPAPLQPTRNAWQIGPKPPTLPYSRAANGGEEGGETDNDRVVTNAHKSGGVDDGLVERRRKASTRPDSPTLPSPPPLSPNEGQQTDQFGHLQQNAPLFETSVPGPSGPFRPDYGVSEWQRQVTQESEQQQFRHPVYDQPRSSQRESHNSAASNFTGLSLHGVESNYSLGSSYMDTPSQARNSIVDPPSPGATLATISPPMASMPGGSSSEQQQQQQQQQQLSGSFASRPLHDSLPLLNVGQGSERALENEQPGLEAVQPIIDIDSGLIPVETPTSAEAPYSNALESVIQPRRTDCSIGPGSSFHLLKGFCEGAKDVQRGAMGVRQVKKLSYSGSGMTAAKCLHCFFELQWTEVDKDRRNLPDANYRIRGIMFRLRFLSKSHLPAKQVDDPLYACLFCLQEGRTPVESDATVFFSQAQLFSHLSRHPRPLPDVPGIRVIDGPERPEEFRNDYDLHFTLPPVISQLDGIQRELQKLPTGTAIDTFRKSHGNLRRPSDSAMPHQFPAGSKIVGIEFPAWYKGEWGVGWFDNVRAPFPAEAVRLDPPPKGEICTQGTSSVRATARWKWAGTSAYRNTDWLPLNKNEVISNIVWSHRDHWCWAGTNSRGKWGYFPQSHVDPSSVKDASQSSDGGSVRSLDRGRPTHGSFSGGGNGGNGGGSGSGSGGGGNTGGFGSGSGSGGGSGFLSRLRSNNSHANTPALRRPISMASTSTSSSR